jgi:predicted nucleotidyltransferase
MCNETSLNHIKRKIVQAARDRLGDKLDKVILYGSYARNDYDEESDIDIMVLANIPRDDCWQERKEIRKLIGMIDIEYDILISLRVTDCSTFYKYIDDLPFYTNVLRDGVELSA